jgi:nitrile hydratase subunit beta
MGAGGGAVSLAPGARVRVRPAFPPGHVRTPFYVRGHAGVVQSEAGRFANPEELAYGRPGQPPLRLLRVRFDLHELFPDAVGSPDDGVVVDLYEHWLEALEGAP